MDPLLIIDSCSSPTSSLFHDTANLEPVNLTDPVVADLTSRRGRPTATPNCGQHLAQDKDLVTIPGHVHQFPTYVYTTAIF